MIENPDVLIVGAGPVGLTMANELARHGLSCRLVDQNEGPSVYSKAQVVHARTLEIFEDMGVIERFVDKGVFLQGVTIYNPELRRIAHVPFHAPEIDSRYTQTLSIPQRDTELILAAEAQRRGISVERKVRLVELHQDAEGVTSTLEHADGDADTRSESVRSRWIIGADGAHSTVRKQLSLPFEGDTYEQRVIQADVRVDWDFRHADDEVVAFIGPNGLLGCFPLPGEHRYRVLTFLNADQVMEPTLETFQRLLDERGPKGTKVSDPKWMVDFRIHRRMVPHYRVGRAFLAGDAAHIHSPAGGQGMNNGIQDAYNLAWKLALAHRGLARDAVLDSYEAERHPIAAAALRGTDRATRRAAEMMSLRHPLALELRAQVIGFITSLEMVQHRVSRLMSMLEVAYTDSPIIGEDHVSAWAAAMPKSDDPEAPGVRDVWDFESGPAPGDRAADVALPGGARLYQVMAGTSHALLLFDGAVASPEGYRRMLVIARSVGERYGSRIAVHMVTPHETRPAALDWDGSVVLDAENAVHRRYGARSECLYLIRPDKHVAYRCQPADGEKLAAFLDTIFV